MTRIDERGKRRGKRERGRIGKKMKTPRGFEVCEREGETEKERREREK